MGCSRKPRHLDGLDELSRGGMSSMGEKVTSSLTRLAMDVENMAGRLDIHLIIFGPRDLLAPSALMLPRMRHQRLGFDVSRPILHPTDQQPATIRWHSPTMLLGHVNGRSSPSVPSSTLEKRGCCFGNQRAQKAGTWRVTGMVRAARVRSQEPMTGKVRC